MCCLALVHCLLFYTDGVLCLAFFTAGGDVGEAPARGQFLQTELVNDDNENGNGATAGRTYLSDHVDGCIHVFAPRPSSTWEYRSMPADETGLISSVSVLGSAGAYPLISFVFSRHPVKRVLCTRCA